jgi:hypothetical protein
MIAAGTAASTETMELIPKALGLMNATFNPAPLLGLTAFYCWPPVVCTTG